MKTKIVSYAYPTSPLADCHNNGEGFYYVSILSGETLLSDGRGDFSRIFATRGECVEYGESEHGGIAWNAQSDPVTGDLTEAGRDWAMGICVEGGAS